MKTCSRCGESKPVDGFYTHKRSRDGLNSECKVCHGARTKKWRLDNKERVAAIKKQWKLDNPDKVARYRDTFNEKHPEKNKEWKRSRYAKLKEQDPKRLAESYRKNYNKEEAIKRAKAWKARNPHKVAELAMRRKASKAKATPSWANTEAIQQFYKTARDLTEQTGIKWEVDHIVPLNSPIVCGLHVETNLRVIPATENNHKGNKLMEELL